jgi:protein associated with RNAse G/E
MNKLCIGDKLQIQCYKHNGKIHRAWDEAILLDDKKDYMVFGNNKTIVTKAEGITWKTKEPAIMYFFKDKWFNIISQLKKDGIYYYCNIASPFIIEENTIKYIDYDLDLRVFPTGQYKILDRLEYNYHKKIMNYSYELDKVICNSLDELIHDYENGLEMFTEEMNQKYYQIYKALSEEKK